MATHLKGAHGIVAEESIIITTASSVAAVVAVVVVVGTEEAEVEITDKMEETDTVSTKSAN